jgi:carbohydrate-binding DOMON domain-containing protein
LRVEDRDGNILAAYFPTTGDELHPLGDAASGIVEFALPRRFLGQPSTSWRFAILVGAQDDHGGSGLGEFRSVGEKQGEWNGGGRTDPAGSNVYDVLLSPP